jgi:outer membrane murein-binding lipoprotein Lpp
MAQNGQSPSGTVNFNSGPQNTGQMNCLNTPQYSMPPRYQYPSIYGLMNSGSPVLSQNSQQSQQSVLSSDLLQPIMQKLEQIDKKLCQLDRIQTIVSDLAARVNSMDLKISDIENSQKFTCEQYDTLSECANLNKRKVDQLESQIQKLSAENKTLKQSSQNLS